MRFVPGGVESAVPLRRRFLLDCALVAGSFGLGTPALAETVEDSPAAPRLRRVRQFSSSRAARIVLRLDGPAAFELERSRPERIVLSLPGVRLATRPPKPSRSGLVRAIRLSCRDFGCELRLSVDSGTEARVFYLPEPFRVVIDLFLAQAAPLEPRRLARVALDPGHGGADPGAVGPSGLLEKNVVLDIVHRAAPLLARELNVATLLTRAHDIRVPLMERVARANDFGADLFLSIHCNAHRRASARGTFTFVLAPGSDRFSRRAAALENGNPLAGPVDDRFMTQFTDTSLARRSRYAAQLLQRAAMSSLSGYPRTRNGGVRGAGFYVLAGALMPAVLFETAFISNPLEEARLATGRYRQRLADSIVNAVRAYREGYGLTPLAPGRKPPTERG